MKNNEIVSVYTDKKGLSIQIEAIDSRINGLNPIIKDGYEKNDFENINRAMEFVNSTKKLWLDEINKSLMELAGQVEHIKDKNGNIRIFLQEGKYLWRRDIFDLFSQLSHK